VSSLCILPPSFPRNMQFNIPRWNAGTGKLVHSAAAPPQKNDSISSVRGAKGESAEKMQKMHTACTDRRLNCKSSRRRAAFVWNGMSQCRTGACCCRTRNILCVDNVQHTHFSCSSGDKFSGYANSDKYSVMCNSSYNLRWKLFLLGYVCSV
jgi:hypothetical protein